MFHFFLDLLVLQIKKCVKERIKGCLKKYGNEESLTESSVCGISITFKIV